MPKGVGQDQQRLVTLVASSALQFRLLASRRDHASWTRRGSRRGPRADIRPGAASQIGSALVPKMPASAIGTTASL